MPILTDGTRRPGRRWLWQLVVLLPALIVGLLGAVPFFQPVQLSWKDRHYTLRGIRSPTAASDELKPGFHSYWRLTFVPSGRYTLATGSWGYCLDWIEW